MFEKKQKDGSASVSKETAESFDVCYKSKLLNKYFDSKDELVKAEDEYKEAHKKELQAKEERQADVRKVESAANAYLSKLKDNEEKKKALDKEATDLYQAYRDSINDFAKKHNGYHLTYKSDGDNVEFKVEEARRDEVSDIFEANRKLMRSFLNDFWF